MIPDERGRYGEIQPDEAHNNTLADRFFRRLDRLFDFFERMPSWLRKAFKLLAEFFCD
ncbi:MAG: hypothetical protein LBI74_08430 [Synergistaceae bacterium]|jgi:hypothetical protein|nr:hypothetical protein [Synergistaceae bacterium]